MRRSLIVAGGVALAGAAFLLFRPDKLFADDPVRESLGEAFTTTTASTSSESDQSTAATNTTSAAVTTNPPAEPAAISSGLLYGIDHRASGTATIYEQEGSFVLRLEDDTDIQNGPDLYIWLLASDSYEGGTPSDYLDLGKLKGNLGGQNYSLPEGFDPQQHRAVLIWCLRFAVPFAAAPLE
jgi:hypothetical protein